MSFFHREVEAQIASLNLSPDQAQAVHQGLVPAAYLESAARKAKQTEDRGPLRELAAKLRTDTEPRFADLGRGSRAVVDRVAGECANVFLGSYTTMPGPWTPSKQTFIFSRWAL